MFDNEISELAGIDSLAKFEPLHPSRGWPMTTPVNQGVDGYRVAFEQSFY
jgi:hypothetical protein